MSAPRIVRVAHRRWAVLAATAIGLSLAASVAKAEPLTLPDSRGWEMVSPADKNGGEVAAPGALFGGGVLQAAADGEATTFSSASSFSAEAQGAPVASQYIARRTPSGWLTTDVTGPTVSAAYGEEPAGVPYRLFSGDLAWALLLNGRRCGEGDPCPRGYSLRETAGGALAASPEASDLRFAGASPDLRHVVFSTAGNLYTWSGGALTPINVLPGGAGTPESVLAAPAGAVSTDAGRVYWNDSTDGRLYLREAGATKWAGESTAGVGPEAFQVASPDGSVAFFTKGAHLYRYEAAANSATDLTPGGEVLGVLGASESGSRVYYLTAAGLFLWQEGAARKVADSADARNYPPATGTARVSPDGTRLAFLSEAPLTGYDNTDQSTGELDMEVFLYDAGANGGTGELACASCRRDGTRPEGASTIPGAIANGTGPLGTQAYKPRVLTAAGNRLFFDSRDALVTQDTNNDDDVYEWEAQGTGSCAQAGGCLGLISSGRSEDGASFVDASASGRDAFFLTDGSLVDGDPGAVDLYDAREGGGFPVPPKPIPCEGDACQPLPSPPEDPTPGTLILTEGNPPVRFPPKSCPKGKRRVQRAGKAGCVPKRANSKKKNRRGAGK